MVLTAIMGRVVHKTIPNGPTRADAEKAAAALHDFILWYNANRDSFDGVSVDRTNDDMKTFEFAKDEPVLVKPKDRDSGKYVLSAPFYDSNGKRQNMGAALREALRIAGKLAAFDQYEVEADRAQDRRHL